MPRDKDDLLDPPTEGEEEEERDDEEEEEEEEEEEAAEAAQTAAPVAPSTKKKKSGKKRQRSEASQVSVPIKTPYTAGAKAAKGAGDWKNEEAELLWPEILAALPAMAPPKTAYDLGVQIVRLIPAPAQPIGQSFDASTIQGDRTSSPGDMLRAIVTDQYHCPIARSEVEYEIRFFWKREGTIAGRGRMRCSHPDEILALNRARREAPRHYPQPHVDSSGGPPPHFSGSGAPPSPQSQSPYGASPPPPPQGGAPYAASSASSATEAELRHQLELARIRESYQQGQISELMAAMREGRAPRDIPPPPAAQAPAPIAAPTAAPQYAAPVPPPAPEISDEEREDRLIFKLAKLGVININGGKVGSPQQAAPPPQYTAPPPQQQPAAPQSKRGLIEEALEDLGSLDKLVGVIGKARGALKKLDTIAGGGEAAEKIMEEAAAEATTEVADLPFATAAVPEAKWANGQPILFAQDKTTGNFSKMGFVVSNLSVAQPAIDKIGESVGDLIGGLGKLAASIGRPNEPQVVDKTPENARDGNVNGAVGGDGWPVV